MVNGNPAGSVFRIAPDGTLTTLYSFPDGYSPAGGLPITADGFFYGTTVANGPDGYGTIFTVTTTGNSAGLRENSTMHWAWAIALIGIVWLPVSGGSRHTARKVTTIVLGPGGILLSSCGGGSSGRSASGRTPAGSYNLTVTATMNRTSQAQALKLIVQ